jgi:hypothetical protein
MFIRPGLLAYLRCLYRKKEDVFLMRIAYTYLRSCSGLQLWMTGLFLNGIVCSGRFLLQFQLITRGSTPVGGVTHGDKHYDPDPTMPWLWVKRKHKQQRAKSKTTKATDSPHPSASTTRHGRLLPSTQLSPIPATASISTALCPT